MTKKIFLLSICLLKVLTCSDCISSSVDGQIENDLFQSIDNSNFKKAKEIIQESNFPVDQKIQNRQRALNIALLKEESAEFIDYLLQKGASPNPIPDSEDESPLVKLMNDYLVSCGNDCTEDYREELRFKMELLLNSGGSLEQKDKDGRSFLDMYDLFTEIALKKSEETQEKYLSPLKILLSAFSGENIKG